MNEHERNICKAHYKYAINHRQRDGYQTRRLHVEKTIIKENELIKCNNICWCPNTCQTLDLPSIRSISAT